MVSSLTTVSSKERMEIFMVSSIKKKKREKHDMIPVFRAMKGVNRFNKENQLVWDKEQHKDIKRNK